MNKFEAKHPRAKDGKFTEKQREESGIALEPNNKRSDGDSREMPTQSNLSYSGNPKPSKDVDRFRAESEDPRVTSSERSSLRTPWEMIKYLAQSFTFAVIAVILALALLCIWALFFPVETDSNKNEPQVPEDAKTAAATIATYPSQAPAPALDQVKPGTAPIESFTNAILHTGNSRSSSCSGWWMVGTIASSECLIGAIGSD